MMKATILPGILHGTIRPPASKSYSQRLLALALLHKGTTVISGFGQSEDEQAALRIIMQSGASVNQTADGVLEITSSGRPSPAGIINCGESALALRMFASILSIGENEFQLTAEGSLCKRPVGKLKEFLPELGVQVSAPGDFPPVSIKGPLHPRDILINGAESSQYLTGLLIALSAVCNKNIHLKVIDPVSTPYTDMTIALLKKFGYRVSQSGYTDYMIIPSSVSNTHIEEVVEPDWSNAAFWLVAGTLSGNIELKGLNPDSCQGDKVILDVLRQCGAAPEINSQSVRPVKADALKAFEFDACQHPDLFPPLAVLAACSVGLSRIKGLSRLANKESNRADRIVDLLSCLGISTKIQDDSLIIEGGRIRGGKLDPGNDHRMVMAASVAALSAAEPVEILHAGAVAKSYPAFFNDLRSLGGCVSLSPEIFMA